MASTGLGHCSSRHGPVSSAKSAKVAERLQLKIKGGEYYEALQTYKALYSRYRAQGRDKEALDLIYDGAITLLQHEQWECGNELALTVVNFYKEKKTPVTDETLQSVIRLFFLYSLPPQVAKGADAIVLILKGLADVTPREQFVRAALKWTSMVGDEESCKYGHPKLHQVLARQYWTEKQYPLSREHFLYAEDPEKFSEMLVEFSTTYGYPAESDLFIVSAVLQLMVLKKPLTALNTYRHYLTIHPNLSHLNKTQPPYDKEPTLNFAWFLLYSAVYLNDFSPSILNWIKRSYKGVMNRDPTFSEYVEKIGTIYCGITQKGKPGEGLMGLLGGPGTGGVLDSLMGSFTNSTPMAEEDQSQQAELPNQRTMLDSDDELD